ncbi:glyoxalase superfamily protein [Thalassococcus sp. S3]|uniref:glyoxalase superfamily protein n=1 Tax=Thalassococcus sp. S3 TaxID=2017482 RepID=UPI0010247D96|nr:glyoxalase superfamily protein [Thalassococcus sp. S3]QBF30978.1 bleomycin resistance family protein [Thalassococcus sp. S3]
MRTFLDAKAMAKSLRAGLALRDIELSHGACLDLVARQFALPDWNVLSARIETSDGKSPGDTGLSSAIPIIRIFSEDKAREFYVDFLGFQVDWEHRFGDNAPLYMQISRDNVRLHLSEHHGDGSPGVTVFVWMRGIAAYHQELQAKAYRYNRPGLEDAPWDAKVMTVSDPFGNALRISEPNAPDDPRA